MLLARCEWQHQRKERSDGNHVCHVSAHEFGCEFVVFTFATASTAVRPVNAVTGELFPDEGEARAPGDDELPAAAELVEADVF